MKKYSFLSFILVAVAGITAAFVANATGSALVINGTLVQEDNPAAGDGALLTCTIFNVVSANCSYTVTGAGVLSATGALTNTDVSSNWGTTAANVD